MSLYPDSGARAPGWVGDPFINIVDGPTRQAVQQVIAQLQGYLGIDHNPDGTHNRIHAVSVTTAEGVQEFGRIQTLGVAEDTQWSPTIFTGSGAMTWLVASTSLKTYKAARIGNLLYVSVSVAATNVGGVANTMLQLQLPWNLKGIGYTATLGFASDAGAVPAAVQVELFDQGTVFSISKFNGANWTLTAGNNTTVIFQGWFAVAANPLV